MPALRLVVLSASSRLASSLTNVDRGRRWLNKARRRSLRRRLKCSLYMKNELQNWQVNLTANAVQCIVNVLRWKPLNEILCMTISPAFPQFLSNLKSIFYCSHENLFFEVISYKLITFIALEKCQKECDTRD